MEERPISVTRNLTRVSADQRDCLTSPESHLRPLFCRQRHESPKRSYFSTPASRLVHFANFLDQGPRSSTGFGNIAFEAPTLTAICRSSPLRAWS